MSKDIFDNKIEELKKEIEETEKEITISHKARRENLVNVYRETLLEETSELQAFQEAKKLYEEELKKKVDELKRKTRGRPNYLYFWDMTDIIFGRRKE